MDNRNSEDRHKDGELNGGREETRRDEVLVEENAPGSGEGIREVRAGEVEEDLRTKSEDTWMEENTPDVRRVASVGGGSFKEDVSEKEAVWRSEAEEEVVRETNLPEVEEKGEKPGTSWEEEEEGEGSDRPRDERRLRIAEPIELKEKRPEQAGAAPETRPRSPAGKEDTWQKARDVPSDTTFRSVSEEAVGRPRICCSNRMLISAAGFVAFFNATLIRIGIVMAIVCMTEIRSRNVTVPDCPPLVQESSPNLFEFAWSSSLQGFVKSGAFYGFLVGPFVSGFLSFRFGGKVILIIGTLCAGVTHAVSPELTRVNPYLLFGVRVLSGFFGGWIFPATFDVLSHWAPPDERQILVGSALIGVPLCSVVNFPINGFLCTFFGWVWIFYVSTIWLFFYCLLAYFVVFDYPQQSPYIKRRELEYIIPRTPGRVKGLKVPWGKILRSMPVHAYIVTHFCINYGFLTIILHLPVFMQEVHHFQLRSNSLLSAAPYLGAFLCRIVTTFTFNAIRDRLKITTNSLRKAFVVIGVSVPSVALLAVSFIPCKHRYAALACFVVFATALELSISGGYLLSLLDMSPSYSNILSGFANAIANSAGLLSAVFTGLITPNGTHEEWNNVFYIAIGFFIIAGMTYSMFGTNELQPWGLAKSAPAEDEGTKSRPLSVVSIS